MTASRGSIYEERRDRYVWAGNYSSVARSGEQGGQPERQNDRNATDDVYGRKFEGAIHAPAVIKLVCIFMYR